MPSGFTIHPSLLHCPSPTPSPPSSPLPSRPQSRMQRRAAPSQRGRARAALHPSTTPASVTLSPLADANKDLVANTSSHQKSGIASPLRFKSPFKSPLITGQFKSPLRPIANAQLTPVTPPKKRSLELPPHSENKSKLVASHHIQDTHRANCSCFNVLW
jgi:hypothetical protein